MHIIFVCTCTICVFFDSDDECVVHGSFDITQITMDPASSVCELDFVPLKYSCDADALPPDFGMKAEVDMTTGHDDTSSMLLWFNVDGGLVYYNEDDPRVTAFLHQDLPSGRKMVKIADVVMGFCVKPFADAGVSVVNFFSNEH